MIVLHMKHGLLYSIFKEYSFFFKKEVFLHFFDKRDQLRHWELEFQSKQ